MLFGVFFMQTKKGSLLLNPGYDFSVDLIKIVSVLVTGVN